MAWARLRQGQEGHARKDTAFARLTCCILEQAAKGSDNICVFHHSHAVASMLHPFRNLLQLSLLSMAPGGGPEIVCRFSLV